MTERAPALEIGRAALVDLSAALATRREEALARAFRVAARHAEAAAVEEVILQAHLFVGFPIALEAMRSWREVAPQAPAASGEPSAEDGSLWRQRGEEICAIVYGDSYERLRANVAALHPALDAWMISSGYGRVLGRPALDLVTRELCVVSLLAVWDAPRQLHSHLRGALNAGAPPDEVVGAVEIACRYLEPGAGAAVRTLLRRVLPDGAIHEG